MRDANAHHDDPQHKSEDDLMPMAADAETPQQRPEHDHDQHQGRRGQVAAWRREFNQLTNGSCAGSDGTLDFEKVKAWQMAHQIEATGTIRRDTIEMARAAADARDDAHGDHGHHHHGKSAEKLPLMPLPFEWTDYLQRHPGVEGLRVLVTPIIAEFRGGELDELEARRKWHACADFSGALPKHKAEVDGLWSHIASYLTKGRPTNEAEGDHGAAGGHGASVAAATGGGAPAAQEHGGAIAWMPAPGQAHLKKDPEHMLPYVAVNELAADFVETRLTLQEMEQRFVELAKFCNANEALRRHAHTMMMEKAFRKMKDQQSPFANANAPNPNDAAGAGGEVLHATIEQAELMQRGGATAVEWAASNVLLPGFERHELSEAQVMQRFDECVRGARIARSDEKRIRTQMEKRMRKLLKQWHHELEQTLARAKEDQLDNEIGDA